MAQYVKTEEGYKEFAAVTDDKMDKTDPIGTGSFSMNRKAGTVIGVNSHAEGSETVASGYISHAEGYQTTASGIDSHAEGYKTTASGSYSHAEGFGTVAKKSNSHAEGIDTTAIGFSSHAEGGSTNKFSSVVTTTNPTTDSIITAWKTKKFSVANGDYSHVEGKDNLALREDSHAEGNQTRASGVYSHAEGHNTIANNDSSHAEGNATIASGYYSHAEGSNTQAGGYYSHAEGDHTIASESGSHAEGDSTKASGLYSHAEGTGTKASGRYSHAEGFHTTASGVTSRSEGSGNTASGADSHAEGSGNTASGDCSHAEGNATTASGTYSHAEGSYTRASGDFSHVQGKFNIEDTSNKYADIIGNGTSDTARSNAATVDWAGNAWFAGDVYTGSTSGTNKDEGSKKLATEEYVNSSIAAGGTDISLGLTSAAVGQIIKVKAVDESGKPTAWEAAEEKTLKWIKVHESTLTENTNIISVGADESGKELQEYNPIGIALVVSTPADATQTNNNGQVWAYPQKDMGDNAIRIISTIAAWKTVNRDSIWIWQGGSTALAYNGNNNGASPAYKVNNYAMNGVYAYIPDTKDHFPVGSTVLVSVLTEM